MSKKCCKQCGEAKPITAYRTYYNGGTSHYKVCIDCEKINSRRKYLEKKQVENRSEADKAELSLIYELYEIQRAKGLAPPRQGVHERGIKAIVANQMTLLSKDEELSIWLTKDLSEYAPEQLEDIYDGLKAKYRPQIGVDPNTVLPVYDDMYKEMLDKILVRFDDYEEDYYAR